jgi:hypothetical protein
VVQRVFIMVLTRAAGTEGRDWAATVGANCFDEDRLAL